VGKVCRIGEKSRVALSASRREGGEMQPASLLNEEGQENISRAEQYKPEDDYAVDLMP